MGTVSAATRLMRTRKKLEELETKVKEDSLSAIKKQVDDLKALGIDCVFYERRNENQMTGGTIIKHQKKVLSPEHLARMKEGRNAFWERARSAQFNN